MVLWESWGSRMMGSRNRDSRMIGRKFSKILIINLGGIGDIILSAPSLKALRAEYPESCISALVSEQGFEMAQKMPWLDDIFVFYINCKSGLGPAKLIHNLKILLRLRGKKFDLAVNMRTIASAKGAFNIRLLMSIIRPGLSAGRDTDGSGSFFDIKIPETLKGVKNESEYDIDIMEALGIKISGENADFTFLAGCRDAAKRALEEKGVAESGIIIGIHPGGKPSHRWPVENFSKTIDALAGKLSCRFVATGTKNEAELALRLKDITAAEIISLAGNTDLNELISLIGRCDLFISNDTGPAHIAAVLNTPLIVLVGAGDLARFDPRCLSNRATVIYYETDCAPCNKIKCPTMKCMEKILPAEVVNASLKLLNNI